MHCWVCGERGGFGRLQVRDADRGADVYCLRLCPACRSGGLEPPPPPDVLNRHYDVAYYGGGDAKFAAPLQAILNLSTRRRARSICCAALGNGACSIVFAIKKARAG